MLATMFKKIQIQQTEWERDMQIKIIFGNHKIQSFYLTCGNE